jgi:isoquinoline 1-oxidoreductase alpha subunit
MKLTINNESREVSGEAADMLLWVLRDELEMTGTKFGCGAGICGACTVHVDGVATRSCITPLAAVEGKAIRTIEGLAAGGSVAPRAASLYRRTGATMWLVHEWADYDCRCLSGKQQSTQ